MHDQALTRYSGASLFKCIGYTVFELDKFINHKRMSEVQNNQKQNTESEDTKYAK